MAESQKQRAPIMPGRVQLLEQACRNWIVTAEQGTTIEELQEPSYWSHMASQFSPYDYIDVRIDDGIYLVRFVVTECSRSWARVHLLDQHNLTTSDVSQSQSRAMEKHRIEWKGPHLKHVVIRNADDEPVKDGFSRKTDAEIWMNQFENTIA